VKVLTTLVRIFGGATIEITQEEYRSILGKNGFVFLKNQSQTINTAGIKRIVPKKVYVIDEMEERRSTQKDGVLHNGRRVIKHFGVWYHEDGDYDERGNPLSRPYEKWYPEVARDCIPTVSEYHQLYAHLPQPERLKAILSKQRCNCGHTRATQHSNPVTIFNWDIHENDEIVDYPPQDSRNVHYCELIDVYQDRNGIKRSYILKAESLPVTQTP